MCASARLKLRAQLALTQGAVSGASEPPRRGAQDDIVSQCAGGPLLLSSSFTPVLVNIDKWLIKRIV